MEAVFAQVRPYAQQLLGKRCSRSLLDRFDLGDRECLTLALSKFIGLGIVVGGSLVKLPQILKILANGTARGVSGTSYLLESLAYSVTLAYNYRHGNPFSTYGETVFVLGQNVIILALMGLLDRKLLDYGVLLAVLGGVNYVLYDGSYTPDSQLTLYQTLTIPVSILSKLPQIWANFQAQSTGQLSVFTVVLFFAGSLARVFTTWREVNDQVILLGYVLATVLNGILVLQMVQYWNNTGADVKGKHKKI